MATLQELETALPALSASDQAFAHSLLGAWKKYKALTPKQAMWADKLVARAHNGSDGRETAQVGRMGAVITLFDNAKQHLKFPAIVLGVPGLGTVRLSIATSRAQVPGSVNVVGADREWFGRILRSGLFEASRKHDVPAGLIEALQCFAADPAKVAGEQGRLSGRCCFCNLPLTDGRSTVVGYGPKCAKNFCLPWGAERHEFKAEEVPAAAA